MRTTLLLYFSTMLLVHFNCTYAQSINERFQSLQGSYLGQKPPGKIPEIFAPGIISTERNQHSFAAFSKDGKEFFWSEMTNNEFNGNILLHSSEENGYWTVPEILEETKRYNEGVPTFSIDGNRLYFSSDRPIPEKNERDFNIWYLEKEESKWSNPKLMSFPPNTFSNREFFICQITDGSFYYTRNNIATNSQSQFGLAKAPCVNGTYTEPKPLGEQFNDGNLNWTPYVDPEETYIIFSSNRDNPKAGSAGCDLFISFRNENNKWTDPINMGPAINTKNEIERFPIVTSDGKYLFFIRGYGNFYWVDASIINDLKPNANN